MENKNSLPRKKSEVTGEKKQDMWAVQYHRPLISKLS